jgi:uncharacterized protein (TIGR03437 family)
MAKRLWVALAAFAVPAAAQLFPVGTPLPKTLLPPVVFVDGYQTSCTASQFSDNFGSFDQFLQASGRVSVFFDNCTLPGKPPIESLGASFGTFISNLRYSDGTAVQQVDVVAHSMGGLILRAYLAGMQTNGAGFSFNPPTTPAVRKAVLLSAPNFGSPAAAIFGTDVQTQELSNGSTFNFALATWNQGTDDMRGIDALAVAGNAGAFLVNGQPDGDGVSSLTSSSIDFALPGRTRILPYCHIPYAALVTLLAPYAVLFPASSVCQVNSQGIANAVNATDSNVLIVQSFLNGTPDWQTIGHSVAQDPLASVISGVLLRARNASDQYVSFIDATVGKTALSLASNNATAYNEFVPTTSTTIVADIVSNGPQQGTAGLIPGATSSILLKPGPNVAAVIPAAALVTPRNIAPGTFISIYGSGLATATAQATDSSFPTILGGTQVLVNGTAIPLQYVSPNQVNAVFPGIVSGLATVLVTTTVGQNTVNVLTQAAVPAIFTADGTAASAVNAVTGAVVTPSTPLHGGDYVSLYVTGLGATAAGAGGLQYASIQPQVTVAGQTCNIQFAGLSPQFPGVDQINCQIPMGLGSNAAAQVIVTSNGRASNTATLVLQ